MSPRAEALVLGCLAVALMGGLVSFSCIRDAIALRQQPVAATAPLHP